MNRLQDGGPGQDQVGAIRADAGFLGPPVRPQSLQPFGRRLAVAARHPQTIDPVAIVAGQVQMDARQAGDRA